MSKVFKVSGATLLMCFACSSISSGASPALFSRETKPPPQELAFEQGSRERVDRYSDSALAPGPTEAGSRAAARSEYFVDRDCAECPELSRIETSEGGAGDGWTLTIGRFEVTWQEYLDSVHLGGCPAPELLDGTRVDAGDPRLRDRVAVTGMGYAGARCYVSWLSKRTGRSYRLPTRAEWEFAARAGAASAYPWGAALGFNNAFVGTAFDMARFPVPRPDDPRSPSNIQHAGLLAPNRYGLYDVIGNAREFTSSMTVLPDEECFPVESPPCNRVIAKSGPFEDEAGTFENLYLKTNLGYAITGFRVVRD